MQGACVVTNDNGRQYAAAVERCETAAKSHGHALGVWHIVDERLHASLFEFCDAMAWLTRPGYEERWRVGGTALEQDCLEEEDLRSELVA